MDRSEDQRAFPDASGIRIESGYQGIPILIDIRLRHVSLLQHSARISDIRTGHIAVGECITCRDRMHITDVVIPGLPKRDFVRSTN